MKLGQKEGFNTALHSHMKKSYVPPAKEIANHTSSFSILQLAFDNV
jgi:hypothetical protein